MNQSTKTLPRRIDSAHIDRVIVDTLFIRMGALEQRGKELEAISVLDAFPVGDAS